jgi:DNA-binding MarR family transcriptional regulator
MVSTTKRAYDGVAAVAEPLGAIVRWSRLQYYQRIAESAQVRIDRSAISVLNMLARHGPLRTSDLALRLGLDRSTISRQVASVVDAGWVSRTNDERDARAALLALTGDGKSVHKKLRNAHKKVARDLVAGWSPDDQEELARLLERLTQRMEQSET